ASLAALQALSLVWLAFAESVVAMFAAIVVFGMTIGNILMLQPLLIAERFGVRDYPRILSRAQLYGLTGTAAGPLLLGWLHDVAGGYEVAYVIAAACSLAGALAFVWAGPTTADELAEPATFAGRGTG